ncbi:MAG: hypothetical protein K6G16_08700 [Lachnospiraceae bacterium]|nr:hypothetical protein [Lachnospiraceae bacterium]
MKHTVIAYSDWEAVCLSFRIRRENRKERKAERDSGDARGTKKRPGKTETARTREVAEAPVETTGELPTLEEALSGETPGRASHDPVRTAAAAPAEGFAAPWPGQKLRFDEDAIRAKGYVRSVQTTLSGVKGYTFFRADGTGQFLRPEILLVQKMARKG